MSNIIRLNNNSKKDDVLTISNSLSSILIDVICFSGSELAKKDDEKIFIVWFAEKNQYVVGEGTIGFDIVEMPWSINKFEKEKEFMIRVINSSLEKKVWEKFEYSVNENMIVEVLNKFKKLVNKMNKELISENERIEWIDSAEIDDPINCNFPKCKKHNILLSVHGCIMCKR